MYAGALVENGDEVRDSPDSGESQRAVSVDGDCDRILSPPFRLQLQSTFFQNLFQIPALVLGLDQSMHRVEEEPWSIISLPLLLTTRHCLRS
jgi:hypothetical protein